MALDFMWAVEPFALGGEKGRHDPLREVVEPCTGANQRTTPSITEQPSRGSSRRYSVKA